MQLFSMHIIFNEYNFQWITFTRFPHVRFQITVSRKTAVPKTFQNFDTKGKVKKKKWSNDNVFNVSTYKCQYYFADYEMGQTRLVFRWYFAIAYNKFGGKLSFCSILLVLRTFLIIVPIWRGFFWKFLNFLLYFLSFGMLMF